MKKTEHLFDVLGRRWMTTSDSVRICGVNSLSQRVSIWRRAGHNIIDKWVSANGSRFKAYKRVGP